MKGKIVSSTFIGALCSHLLTCDKLVTQALVWLLGVWYGAVCFSASHENLRQSSVFMCQLTGNTLSYIQVNTNLFSEQFL